jgi:CheY-like chemotaxis protein
MARILLIEDDQAQREILRLILERQGHEVLEASEGEAGLTRFGREGADLVLTDLIMPGKEGLETIQEFRRRHPGVKIIAMSGGARVGANDYLKVAQQFGAIRILAKPFSHADLKEAIAAALPANSGAPLPHEKHLDRPVGPGPGGNAAGR